MLIGVLKRSREGRDSGGGDAGIGDTSVKLGYEVVVEPRAGMASGFSTRSTSTLSASVDDALRADAVFGVNAPSTAQLHGLGRVRPW